MSSLTWNIYPTKNKLGGFFIHPTLFKGYISNVEFFTSAGKTYIVIGVTYDPVLNTHDVNCIVLGFNENEVNIKPLRQKIIATLQISKYVTSK